MLAIILAREAVFGISIMAQCTPLGTKKKKALPQRELYQIKSAIFFAIQNAGCSPASLGISATLPYCKPVEDTAGGNKITHLLCNLYPTSII